MKWLVALVALSLFSLSAHSEDEMQDRLYAAFNLLEVMGLESQTKEMIDRMVSLEVQNNPGLVPFKKVMLEFYNEYMGYENMRYETAEIYASMFTTQEMNQMIDFYKTEVGQKIIEKTPEITQRSVEAGMNAVQDNIYKLQDMIKTEALKIQQLQESNN